MKAAKNRVVFRDGAALAALEGGKIHHLQETASSEKWEIEKNLRWGKFPPRLKVYLG